MAWDFPHAKVVSVHDGDTATIDIDLGFEETKRVNVRFLGCNAIELSQPGGTEARDNLTAIIPAGTPIALHSVAYDKYGGRVDGHITLPDGQDLTTLLIRTGWAAAWDGTGKAPTPPWPRQPNTQEQQVTERWTACRFCDAPAEYGSVCSDCRRNTRLPSKAQRKA
jgi:endonuclease YncB( thermonuclease family)